MLPVVGHDGFSQIIIHPCADFLTEGIQESGWSCNVSQAGRVFFNDVRPRRSLRFRTSEIRTFIHIPIKQNDPKAVIQSRSCPEL